MDKIRELIDKLNYYTKYYDKGESLISDKEWDDMYFELVKLEQKTGKYYEDSPTQRVNYQVVNELKKVEHSHPMLSLDKTKDIDIIKSFIRGKEYIAMAKMDGLTCSLTYENGKLVKAETRGNGIIGEDILHNALQVKNIPNKINLKGKLVIDGEIICTYKNFEQFKNEYKNPRNFASGSIRLLDSKESSNRNLTFIAWDLIECSIKCNKLIDKLRFLQELSFDVVPSFADNNIDRIENFISDIKRSCEAYYYPIDGIVFKYNNCKEYENAGRTDHHFKGGIAYKFYDEIYPTKLLDIEWTMGRTGQLTPVAIYEPVDIEGTENNRASLHNISIMKELLGVPHLNQPINIFKANQIIPQVYNAEEKEELTFNHLTTFLIPNICPVCGGNTEVRKDNDSEVLYCTNPNCEGKLLNRLDHFCGKKGLDIKGLSKATLEKLLDWGWINTYQDIFLLGQLRDRWIKKPGFGVASVDKILNAIQEAKENATLEQVIAAAGIPEIGTRVAKDLAKHYASWSDFRTETNFLQYDGIGEVMNHNLLTFDYEDLNLDYTVNLHLGGAVKKEIFETDVLAESLNKLEGKVFCITGRLQIIKNREILSNMIENNGGKVSSSISSKISYLINNDIQSNSSKNLTAKKLNIPIISEQEFLNMIGD